jgi:4a-hydroxytetrahydrobiopterin dehydratase
MLGDNTAMCARGGPVPPSGMTKLPAARIKTALRALPEWHKQGATLARTHAFKNFPAAIRFVNRVAKLAEAAWHHPDIDIRWNKVTLTLTTHDAGGLTRKDFALARQFDRLVGRRRSVAG